MKQFSEACEENKQPILAVLEKEFSDCRTVLEIGSGTGQHALFFARQLPHITWQPSDLPASHASIDAWRATTQLPNLLAPLTLDVRADHWPEADYDAVFSANTTHIIDWPAVQDMFRGIGEVLQTGGVFCLYGPFNYNRRYTSESNARFDQWLKQRDPASGLRDFEDLERLAGELGLTLAHDYEMPVNNRLLVWRAETG
ncbi:MAG: class I SAM-dependent methyltransferase [Gammaproteobacteria bacterium]|nr:class I SAM-dependent methyltransferase [Gammaproteobacteria bacterium]MDH3560374.1 class I SAM-dependent methyltransferase [Gammaproteobacteria bacterium]